MGKKLYVGNLPWATTDQDIRDLFGQHGEVVGASIVTDKETGRSRGFGFVEMANDADAAKAIQSLHEYTLDNRTLTVNEARERTSGGGSRGGFTRNGGGRGGRDRDDRY